MVPPKSSIRLSNLTSVTIDSRLRLITFGPWCLVIAQKEQLPEQPRTMVTESRIIR